MSKAPFTRTGTCLAWVGASCVMMLDLSSDGAPEAVWTTDLNGAGEESMQLTLGELELSIVQPGSSASHNIGTGAMVWQAGPALAATLMSCGGGSLREQFQSGRAIELGCGCSALPGVSAALLGAAEVLVSDSAAVIDQLRPNVEAYFATDDAVAAAKGAPPILRTPLRDVLAVAPLAWDDPAALGDLARHEHGRSIVLAADCDYADTLHAMLLNAVSAALSPTCTSVALFATAARCQRTLRLFLSRLSERRFDVVELSAALEPLPPSAAAPSPAHDDGVRYFAARWRSTEDARAARARFANAVR